MNPFNQPGKDYGATDTASRIQMIKRFDRFELEAALEVEGLQATVERAIRSRIRNLRKRGAK